MALVQDWCDDDVLKCVDWVRASVDRMLMLVHNDLKVLTEVLGKDLY